MNPNDAIAKRSYRIHIVRHYHRGFDTLIEQCPDLLIALLFEFCITDREYLVNEQDIRFHNCRNGKGKFGKHPIRVRTHGHINKIAQFGKSNDFIKLCADLIFPETKQ